MAGVNPAGAVGGAHLLRLGAAPAGWAAVDGGAPPEVVRRLAEFTKHTAGLRDWRRTEYQRLASVFDPLADVPLRLWQQWWPPSRQAPEDAISSLLWRELPLGPPRERRLG